MVLRLTKPRCLRLPPAISAARSSAANRSAFTNPSVSRSGTPRTTSYRNESDAQSPKSRNNNANIGQRLTIFDNLTFVFATEVEPGHGSPGQRFWPGRVGSRVSASYPVFDPVLSFNMRVYRDVVSTE